MAFFPKATLLLFAATASAEKINLPWCKPAVEGPYESRLAKDGDTVVLDWIGEAHNAYIYPSGECLDNRDREYLGEQPGVSYTFVTEDVGTTKTFICSISNHCVVGQIVTFEVVSADTAVEYNLETPCGQGFLGEPPTDPPAEESSAASLAVGTAATLLAVGAILLA